jgi:hypothetical protein
MNEAQRRNINLLRSMESSEATDWLLENHPKDGCIYIAKRSWKKGDQTRLAEHFLSTIPHASAICYEALLSVMSVAWFSGIVEKLIPEKESDRDLLKYYLLPALTKAAKTDKDNSAIIQLKSALQC